jgi:exopolyphosphatase/guanosine-5'-triphosphate,3'-diphosphate pyrophosphatase
VSEPQDDTRRAALAGFVREVMEADRARQLAALDLGSNSFHMIVAQEVGGRLQVIDRIKEMVRLGAGLTASNKLDPTVAARALACLERFGQRLKPLKRANVRVVGTYTLREMHNSRAFLDAAAAALGHPVEIISGREEARLIFLGVCMALEDNHDRRLVVDIGGGSTEIILGRRFEPDQLESLQMGCVSWSTRFFKDGRITRKRFAAAIDQAASELTPIRRNLRAAGWDTAIGASGSILAVQAALGGPTATPVIDAAGLERLRRIVLDFGHVDALAIEGVPDERRAVFAGGLAVLMGVVKTLGIDGLRTTTSALREGLLEDLRERAHHEDNRARTVASLTTRFRIDAAHARHVRDAALALLDLVAASWKLEEPSDVLLLGWAADLHEIGMDVSHSRYHKHGEYLITHLEMPGFSNSEQAELAALVRAHRRKLLEETGNPLMRDSRLLRLAILLRLAVVLHRNRSGETLPEIGLNPQGSQLELLLPRAWLRERPLTRLDLRAESAFLRAAGVRLTVSTH